jgi:hypothetical protein
MIRSALLSGGVQSERFAVIPFPIEDPAELLDFLPSTVPVFTTVYDAWNEEKIRLLTEVGYTVHTSIAARKRRSAGWRSGSSCRTVMPAGAGWCRQRQPHAHGGLQQRLSLPTDLVPQLGAANVDEATAGIGIAHRAPSRLRASRRLVYH